MRVLRAGINTFGVCQMVCIVSKVVRALATVKLVRDGNSCYVREMVVKNGDGSYLSRTSRFIEY